VALAWRQVDADRAHLDAWRLHAASIHNHLLALAAGRRLADVLARESSPGSPLVAAVVSATRFLEEEAGLPGAPPEANTRVTQAWASLAPWLPTCDAVDAALAGLDRVEVTRRGEAWRLFRGRKEPAPEGAWTAVEYDDSRWELAPSTFAVRKGLGRAGTILEDMPRDYSTIYLRWHFALVDPATWARLVLDLGIEGGFIAFLNGTEVARGRAGVPGERREHRATADPGAELFAQLDLPLELLRAGANVFAVQAFVGSPSSPDFRLSPILLATGAAQPERDRRLLAEAREQAARLGGAQALRYLEGRLLQRSGAHAEAAAVFRDLTGAPGAETPPHSRLVESLRALGREAEARAALVDLIAAIPVLPVEDARLLAEAGWQVLRLPGRELDDYARAAIWVGRASELAPMNVMNLSRLGAARYRLGLHEEAVSTLNPIRLLSQEMFATDLVPRTVSTVNLTGVFDFDFRLAQPRWRDAAFLAMASYRLGKRDEAREALERLRDLVRDLPEDPGARFAPFVLEAERLVGPLLDSPAGR
jgi:tetratricopeptide (TPR) repeat protein